MERTVGKLLHLLTIQQVGLPVGAELVRASYIIDTLSMLKVEGSNPGGGIFFANKIVN